MRARHTAHSLPAFPVYSAAFISDNELVLGAGGGTGRSGIKNKLRLYNVGEDRSLKILDEFELGKEEDAPMSMVAHPKTKQIVCGINSTMERVERGENENCRVYSVKENKLVPGDTRGTLTSGDTEDYQKVTALSPDGAFLAASGNHDVSLLAYPSLIPVAQPIHAKGDIYDATFMQTSSGLLIATTANLLLYSLPKHSGSTSTKNKKGKQKEQPLANLELLKTIEPPPLPGGIGADFRSARFHPTNDKVLYTVLNTVSGPRSRKTKSIPRQAFVCKWNTETWQVIHTRKLGDKAVTCFDISPDGKFMAYGASDYSIGVLDTHTLSPLLTILKAHEFPPTTLRFNPTSKILVSGSVDNSIRVVTIPESLGGQSWGTVIILVTLVVILLAMAMQLYK